MNETRDHANKVEVCKNYFLFASGELVRQNKCGTIKTLEGANKGKYKVMHFRKDGKNVGKCLHVLYAEAFIPNPNKYKRITAKDGNFKNVSADNLEWAPTNNFDGKLSQEQRKLLATEITKMYSDGNTFTDIANKFSVSRQYIHQIYKKRAMLSLE